LIGIALAETALVVWLAREKWAQTRSLTLSGLAEDFSLPTDTLETAHNDEVDLIVLGESSAKGFPCQEWLSIGRIVAWQLECAIPGKRFQAQILAHEGDTLEDQHRRLAGIVRRPGAVIVYCGHNEFAARYPPERRVNHYLDQEPSSGRRSLAEHVRSNSPLCRLVQRIADGHRVGVRPSVLSRCPLIDVPICSDFEYAERVVDFRRRLDVIVTYCEQIGALPVLVIPPSNDADFEPNRSFLSPRTSPAERESIQSEFLSIRRKEDTEAEQCTLRYRDLLSRQPQFAEAHFRLARLLQRSGQWEQAYRHYISARDLDGLPIRCQTPLQEAYREVARRHQCILIDGQSLCHAVGDHGLLDDRLFHDAMHPSLRGHLALAQGILEELHVRRSFGWAADSPAPVIDPAACAAHFGIDAHAWKSLCERGAMFYYAFASSRYDGSERSAKQAAFMEAAKRIGLGELPEAVGLANIGITSNKKTTALAIPGAISNPVEVPGVDTSNGID
jgi:hypothetical protein